MSDLIEIREMLQETNAALAQVERSLGANPDDWTLPLTAQSLRQRFADLEKSFSEAASAAQIDLCRYKRIPEFGDRYPIMALTSALSAFQSLVTTVFDAIRNEPKIRARLGADIVALTTFDFGYSYPGSLGIVLTMPNDRLLLGESDLDLAVNMIFAMARADKPEDVVVYAKRVGVASIRRLYNWTRAHTEHGISADIQWEREQTSRGSLVIQVKELVRLREILERTSDEVIARVLLEGELIGLDVGARNFFHISAPNADDVVGKISEDFDRARPYQIHGWYRAKILKKTKIYYSTEREEEIWELTELIEVG